MASCRALAKAAALLLGSLSAKAVRKALNLSAPSPSLLRMLQVAADTFSGRASHFLNSSNTIWRALVNSLAASMPVASVSSFSPVSLSRRAAVWPRSVAGSVHCSIRCRSFIACSPCTPNTAFTSSSISVGRSFCPVTPTERFSPKLNPFWDRLKSWRRTAVEESSADSLPSTSR